MTRKTSLTLCLFFCLAVSSAQTANFTAAVTSGCSPLVVNFQDQSTGNPASWFWDFGNGATATLQNPSTTYFTPGTYTVTLTVTSASGSNTLTRTQYITVYGKPTVNFTVNDSTACFPHRAQFTDLSTPAPGTTNTQWLWDFGDGTQSTQQNPLHIYTNTGNYPVTLKVTNNQGCYSVLTKQMYIIIAGGVTSDFTNTQPTTCRPPFNISFTNNSSGPGTLTWLWDFGDGTTSTLQNPVYTYTTPGNYTVSLATTSSDGCSDTMRKVSVLTIQNINTTFNAPDSACINTSINFSNTATPVPLSSNWIFGDGSTSMAINPVKSYAATGTYTVTLYNTYTYCTDSVTRIIRINPRPVANFTSDVTSRCQPNLTVNFQDQSTNALSWQWDFGDGTQSTQQNPTHIYTNYGSFTVQLVVTNNFGCTDTIRRNNYIRIARPVINFSNMPQNGCIPYSIAPIANIVTLDAVTSYLWNFGDGTTSTSPTPSHTYTNQGTYSITLTITTATGCTETYTHANAVRVGRRPIVNFSGTPNPVCAFQPVQFTDLTNEADQWLWVFGDGTQSTQQNPLHEYSDTGKFNVILYATNNGCRDSLLIPNYITVKPPIARFGYQTTCLDRRRFTFSDSSIGATSWLWDFGDGTTSTLQNPVHVFPSYATYNVTLTVNNDTCSHSVTKPVAVINEAPDFVATPNPVCRNSTVNFNATSFNRSNIVTYYWDVGSGTYSLSSFPSTSNFYTASGYYTIGLITVDMYGCRDTTIKPNYVRINGPVAGFTATNTSGCKGLTTTFNDLSQNDGISNIVSWRWDFGDGVVQTFTGPPFTHTYVNAGTYSVGLTVTDAGGCSDTRLIPNLVIATDPRANFSSADTLSCPNSTVQFTNISNALNYTSFWDFGNGQISALNSPGTTYPNSGLYSVKLRITDQYGCSDSLTRTNYITVSQPVASFTVNDSISSCTPFEVQFNNTSQYYISFLWNLSGGISTQQNPVQFYNTPGTYPIQLMVTSPGNCIDTAYGNIYVYDTIGSNVTYMPLNGCKPLSVDLEAFSPGPMTYTWDFGDGVLITNTDTAVNHIYNFFGDFIPKVIMTDPSGCIIPVTGLDTIRIKGATAKFGLDNRLFCDSGLVRFTDSTTFNDSLMGYQWDFGDGTTSTVQNPIHFYGTPGLYTVSLNVQTQNACVDTFRLNNVIKIVQSPLISIAGDSVICVFDSILHTGRFDRSDTSAVQWSWQFPNGKSSFVQYPVQQQYTTAGNFVVRATATNSTGCADTTTQNILVNPLPSVTMPSTLTMQVGFPVQIPATYTRNVTNYTWSPASTLSCSDCPQPIAAPKFNTNYTISFVDSNGCRNTGQIQIIVICKNANVFVPNTFSPNGDGSNDVFYVRGRGLDRVKSLRIFNRWGEVVFEAQQFPVNDPAFGWNGKYKGNKPIPDVYVYQVEVFCDNSQIIRFDGNIALIQ